MLNQHRPPSDANFNRTCSHERSVNCESELNSRLDSKHMFAMESLGLISKHMSDTPHRREPTVRSVGLRKFVRTCTH